MEEIKQNKMAIMPLKKLFWKMGLPMMISMILQALYNVVDSIFVANIEGSGAIANEALTYAFPIQILIIAIGVGTGVGLNALLSKSLGERNKEKVNQVAGNGIFLSLVIYAVFLLFGLFGSEWFISLFTEDAQVIEMGKEYLMICSSLSLGSIGFTIYERFLQATGKTMYSTIAQISGAVVNIVFDYVFIFPLNMGVSGAAWATVMGQFVSLGIAMVLHYTKNKEVSGNLKYIKPKKDIIKGIYSIGVSSTIMQGLLSIMMAGMNVILGSANANPTVLVGSFGIYYKIQQIALFSCFGLSNTIITILSFNYGMKDKNRSKDCIKYGIIDTFIVTIIITVLFEIIANPLSRLFALSGGSIAELVGVCEKATRIASIGYVFMGFTVAVQGVLQALRYAFKPFFTALCRLALFVFPIAYLFTLSANVVSIVWWTFPIAELLTAIISFFILKNVIKTKIETIEENIIIGNNLIVTISREHGTRGKRIGKLLADKLNIKFYDKELTRIEAKQRGLDKKYIAEVNNSDDGYMAYLSLDASKDSVIAQNEIILALANKESFVIVGRCADYYLRNHKNLVKVFLYADEEFKISKIMEMYGDSKSQAKENIEKSNVKRSNYYTLVTGKKWGDKNNYDLYINANDSEENIVSKIEQYIKDKKLNYKDMV